MLPNFLQILTAFLFFSFSFSLIDKNVASSSSTIADVVVAAKGKKPAAETSQIPAAETEWERFRADRCQWPLGRPHYEVCLLIEHSASLFVDVSGDAITVPASYARREDFSFRLSG